MKTIISSFNTAFPGTGIVDKPWFIVTLAFKLNDITQYITIDEWMFDNFVGREFFDGPSPQILHEIYDNNL